MREGIDALWHRRGRPARPVVVFRQLKVKVKVIDAVASTRCRLVLRNVHEHNLTPRRRRSS